MYVIYYFWFYEIINLILVLSTAEQLKNLKKKKRQKGRIGKASALKQCPQVKGTIARVRVLTPKKPNSARRPIAKVKLVNRRRATAHIPGIGHSLRRHSTVLVRGGGARDLPGVNYTCCRGVHDLYGVIGKKRRRSIYGNALNPGTRAHVRRKIRAMFQ